jgi:hypothetical protein
MGSSCCSATAQGIKGEVDPERTMAAKDKASPNAMSAATDAEVTAADAVRAERQAIRKPKAAAAQAKGVVKKPDVGSHADRRKNAFGIAASASKATAVSRAIISRARGGRKR